MKPCEYVDPKYGVTKGLLIKRVQAFQPLTDAELLKYANLTPGDRFYNSVRGERCKVERVIIQRDNGSYVIGPTLVMGVRFPEDEFEKAMRFGRDYSIGPRRLGKTFRAMGIDPLSPAVTKMLTEHILKMPLKAKGKKRKAK